MNRLYETTYIINAALEDAEIDSIIGKVNDFIVKNEGNIEEVNKWGRKRLAYQIDRKNNGFYCHTIFTADSSTIAALERFFVLEETVMRHMTLQLTQKLREHRVKWAVQKAERAAQMSADGVTENSGGGRRDNRRTQRVYQEDVSKSEAQSAIKSSAQ